MIPIFCRLRAANSARLFERENFLQKPCHCETSDRFTGCGERTERCRWQRKRSERVAAVKILSVRRKAAQKFWAPQQGHPHPPSLLAPLPKGGCHGEAVTGGSMFRTHGRAHGPCPTKILVGWHPRVPPHPLAPCHCEAGAHTGCGNPSSPTRTFPNFYKKRRNLSCVLY